VFYGDAAVGSLGIRTDVQGASYVNPASNLAFMVFCTSPNSLDVTGFDLSSTVPNPGYSEQEDNDDPAAPEPLPAFPFAGFTGNVGLQGDYDGDNIDIFSFNGVPGETYKFTITPANPTESFLVFASDNTGTVGKGLAFGDQNGVFTLCLVVSAMDVQPLELAIVEQDPNTGDPVPDTTDYIISGAQVSTNDEVEDNDSTGEATLIPAQSDFALRASLGSGGYDGDYLDFYSFGATLGDQPLIVLWYNPATGSFDFGGDPPVILDSNSQVVCTGEDGTQFGYSGLVVFQFPTGISGTSPYFVRCDLVSPGTTNYWLQGNGTS
jgi:hypothetical protein